ncbi:MAG: STAS domain-containing protein [Chitinivibrionales bacterium]|nr:STAS domain-containing protein [Chitinivibrionales bacterium]MBD3396073.1 STAS domain-containing protein [Chitinivibrionales bacterium]
MRYNYSSMRIERMRKNDCVILRVREDLSAKSNLAPLKAQIAELVRKDILRISLAFTESSYFHTHTIAILVQCIEIVHEKGGALGIINPNEEILDVLNTISLDKLVRIYATEDAAVADTAVVN